jgi:hypothetical protein
MHERDKRFRPRGTVTREKVTFEDVLELIELGQPPTVSWTTAGFDAEGTFPAGAVVGVYGGPGDGIVRRRVTLHMAASRQVDPSRPRRPQERRRFEIRGPGVRRQGVLRRGQERTETFDLCVRRLSVRGFRLRATGAGVTGPEAEFEGVPIGVKVVSIDVADVRRPCPLRRSARPSRGDGRKVSAHALPAP